jgi:TM2 domain-containing membrane protein YozV
LSQPLEAPQGPTPETQGTPVGNPVLAMVLAWLVPGLGHMYLGRRGRALLFFLLIVVCLWVGTSLQGNLYRPLPGQPLTLLATFGAMGTSWGRATSTAPRSCSPRGS